MDVKYKQLVHYDNYFTKKPEGDAAVDLRLVGLDEVVYCKDYETREIGDPVTMDHIRTEYGTEDYLFEYGKIYSVHTGISTEFDDGYVGKISLRSSFGRQGFVMMNAPGLVDSQFRGEILVTVALIAIKRSVLVPKWCRLAQMTIESHQPINLVRVSDLTETERGVGGFGSTGAV